MTMTNGAAAMHEQHGVLIGDGCENCRYLVEFGRWVFRCTQAAQLAGHGHFWKRRQMACGLFEDARGEVVRQTGHDDAVQRG